MGEVDTPWGTPSNPTETISLASERVRFNGFELGGGTMVRGSGSSTSSPGQAIRKGPGSPL
jgi:hypothetical protein